eukprot:TRINITY_DN67599_c9_g1_i1.p2 TRINITY_DN67599_c9_g1~~TRINITY_DN67599_c9_g1_i1.p2  ORF type:complete len:103 (-),score=0.69 TRINITY_DN67599_c9_g1_i1:256-564(-)
MLQLAPSGVKNIELWPAWWPIQALGLVLVCLFMSKNAKDQILAIFHLPNCLYGWSRCWCIGGSESWGKWTRLVQAAGPTLCLSWWVGQGSKGANNCELLVYV